MQQKQKRNRNDKRFGPRSQVRKEQMKLTRCDNPGAREFVPRPGDGAELRRITAEGSGFVYQSLIDEWRSFKW